MKKNLRFACVTLLGACCVLAASVLSVTPAVAQQPAATSTTTTSTGTNGSTTVVRIDKRGRTRSVSTVRGFTRTAPATGTTFTAQPSRTTLSGSLVEGVRSRQPLQMINPFAPASYSDGQGNVRREPEDPSQRPRGFKLLAIEF